MCIILINNKEGNFAPKQVQARVITLFGLLSHVKMDRMRNRERERAMRVSVLCIHYVHNLFIFYLLQQFNHNASLWGCKNDEFVMTSRHSTPMFKILLLVIFHLITQFLAELALGVVVGGS